MRPLFVLGTRPEVIKLAPVIRECEMRGIDYWCYFTGQHAEESAWLARYFEIARGTFCNQFHGSPCQQASRYLFGVEYELSRSGCDVVVGQGDTFSALAAAQAAFYCKKPFVHVEAGLRTDDLFSPWPEEYHRRVISITTMLHCCPTKRAAANVRMWEWGTVVETGNTAIDSLLWTVEQESEDGDPIKERRDEFRTDDGSQDEGLVIVTAHRRENHGGGIARICQAVCALAERFPRVGFFWPTHPNPVVQEEMRAHPSWPRNCIICDPWRYPRFAMLLKNCTLVMTDSGGLQEESPTFKKPVLVLRDTTERQELVEAGGGILVGTNVERIVEEGSRLLSDGFYYAQHQVERNPFGDGGAAVKIVDAMKERFA